MTSIQQLAAAAILARRFKQEQGPQEEAYNDGLNDAAQIARNFTPTIDGKKLDDCPPFSTPTDAGERCECETPICSACGVTVTGGTDDRLRDAIEAPGA